MQPQEIQALAHYHTWANDRLMRRAVHLSTEQLQTPSWLSQKTVVATLVHMLDVQWSWRQVCETSRLPSTYISTSDFATMKQFRRAWQADDQALVSYTTTLSEEQLGQPITYSWPQARPRTKPLWHILLHIINHGTHHRAEVGQYLATIDRSPGDMDLLNYLATRTS
jgi:uncharacterized damage-inducible protein DinB